MVENTKVSDNHTKNKLGNSGIINLSFLIVQSILFQNQTFTILLLGKEVLINCNLHEFSHHLSFLLIICTFLIVQIWVLFINDERIYLPSPSSERSSFSL